MTKFIALTCCIMIATSMSVKAQEIVCPVSVDTNDLEQPSSKFDGWTVTRLHAKQILNGFEVNFGDPKISDGAIYDDVQTIKSSTKGVEKIYIWNLKTVKDPYVTCLYTFTSFGLIRKAANLSKCEMQTLQKHPEGKERIISARCF
jgi:hypothetical protein